MARIFQTVSFNDTYIPDRGGGISYNGRFVVPPDISAAEAAQIAVAAGGVATPLELPCPEGVDFKPRKLIFERQSGNTVGVPIANRANLITAGNAIAGILNKAGNKVVCVKLEGETWASLNDELGVSLAANEYASDSRPANGTKQYIYSGTIAYESDPAGGIKFVSVKVATDTDNAPPTNLGAVWNTCVGAFTVNFSCGKASNPNHRRYYLDLRIGEEDPNNAGQYINVNTERKEVPVKDFEAASILTCGQSLATLTGVYCIGYEGESYGSFHRLLTLP